MTQDDRRPRATLLQVGNFRVDLESDTVSGPEGASGLHRRAEELLCFLCRNPNVLVTREQILQSVWGGRPVEEAAITNCVWQIRKVLGEDAKTILQTRAKQGYLLSIPESAWVERTSPGQSFDEAATANVAVAYPLMRPSPLYRRRWLSYGFAFAALMSIGVALTSGRRPFAPQPLSPDAGLSVSIDAADGIPWLRAGVLHEAAEAALLVNTDLVVFERRPRRFPFAGAHLHVQISAGTTESVVATIVIHQGEVVVRKPFRGNASALKSALRDVFRDRLGVAYRAISPAEHAYMTGKLAELRHERLGAIASYRRAIARTPDMLDADIAMASLLDFQGRSLEAHEAIARLERNDALHAHQRCRLQTLAARAAPDRDRNPACAQARDQMLRHRGDWQALIASADRGSVGQLSPKAWMSNAISGVVGRISAGDYEEAEAQIAHAEGIARDAGWDSAALEIGAHRALVEVYKGRLLQAAALHRGAADGYRRIGDIQNADYHMLYALRASPGIVGEQVTARREQLSAIVERARRLGSIANELEALQLLARLDRGDDVAWNSHISRLRYLGDTALSPDLRVQNDLYILDEFRFQRRYAEVLEGLKRLGGTVAMDARIWSGLLRIESHFARDELRDAIAVVQQMERDGIDPLATGSACQFAWLFAEAGLPARARELLRLCADQPFDRIGQATRGDFAHLAEARIRRSEGLQSEAWEALAPRIAALLAQERPLPQEVESMLLLSRHAVGLPGADTRQLQRALSQGESLSKLDGAGPTLRFGVHMLRWRLCAAEGRTDCGPVLPQSAMQDRFEARLAEESVARTRDAPVVDAAQWRRPLSRAAP
jgi:DNA-binding winged helix-turn-helix (wHTH) protein